jgi:hypothetical protein
LAQQPTVDGYSGQAMVERSGTSRRFAGLLRNVQEGNMAKLVNNDNDDAVVPETAYQDEKKPMSGRSTSLSIWGLVIAAIFVAALAIFAFTRNGAHTDPAPSGGMGNSGATTQPAPAQNSQ